jgi:hypothetical protein
MHFIKYSAGPKVGGLISRKRNKWSILRVSFSSYDYGNQGNKNWEKIR